MRPVVLLAGILVVAAAPAGAWRDRMDCAVKAGGDLSAEQIILNCGEGLTDAEMAAFREWFVQSAERERALLTGQGDLAARIEAMEARILAEVRGTDGYARMKAAGVTENALIELARRIAVDVSEPGPAFAELQQAVEVAIRVQREARDNPSTDAFVAEVRRQVAALSAAGDYEGASAAAEAALAEWEVEQAAQRQRGIDLLRTALDQDILRRDAEAAAGKLVRIADLEAGGVAGQSEVREVALDYQGRGERTGSRLDLRIAVAVTNLNLERIGTPVDRATLLNDNGNSLWMLGRQASGPEGVRLLADAVAAYRAALEVRTEAAHPLDRAQTQNNLALALKEQAGRSANPEAGRLLAEAIALHRESLRVLSETENPENWAMQKGNLGAALLFGAQIAEGAEATRLIWESIGHIRDAMRVQTEADQPLAWARSQLNLGIAQAILATRRSGLEAMAFYASSVAAYRAALRVFSEDAEPMNWARTQLNLGVNLATQGMLRHDEAGAALIDEALVAYRAVLRVFTEDEHPLLWAQTQSNLGLALAARAEHAEGAAQVDLLREAVAAQRAATRVLTEAETPVQWAGTEATIAATLTALGSVTGGAEGARLLTEAVESFERALRGFEDTGQLASWGWTMRSLATTRLELAINPAAGDPRPHLEAALADAEAALAAFDPEHMGADHAEAVRLRDEISARLAALDGE